MTCANWWNSCIGTCIQSICAQCRLGSWLAPTLEIRLLALDIQVICMNMGSKNCVRQLIKFVYWRYKFSSSIPIIDPKLDLRQPNLFVYLFSTLLMDSENGEVLFDRPKPPVGCSANGKRGRRRFVLDIQCTWYMIITRDTSRAKENYSY